MIRRLFFLACGFVASTGLVQAMTMEAGDVGPIHQFQTARSSFTLVNDTDEEVKGLKITPLRPQDRVLAAPNRIAARGNVVIDVEVDAQNDLGSRGHTFRIDFDGAAVPLLGRVSVYGLSVLHDPARVLDFDTVKAGDSPVIDYALETDDPAVRIAAIKSAPEFVTVSINPDKRGLRIRHSDKSTWGKLTGLLKIQLDSSQQKEAWIPIHTEVRGDVLPSTTNFSLGVARIGQENEYILQYRSEGKPFKLDRATLEGIDGKTTIQNCTGGDKFCQQVRMLIDGNQRSGQLNGILRTHVAGYDRDIVVLTGGLLVSKDVKIKSLDEALAAQADAPKPSPSLNQALKSMSVTEKPVEAVIPPGNGPLLRWSVDNENLLYGYAIFRADSAQGPFQRVGDIVRRSVVSKQGVVSNYAARDTGAVVGKEYWYRIAMFYSDGKREFLTEPQHVKVKEGGVENSAAK